VADVGNPFTAQVIRTIEAVAYRNGHDVFLEQFRRGRGSRAAALSGDSSPTDRRPQRAPVTFGGAATAPPLSNDMPVVCLGRKVDGCALDSLLVDNPRRRNHAGGRAPRRWSPAHRRDRRGPHHARPGRARLVLLQPRCMEAPRSP
jgi:hypothetical protein